MTLVRNYVLPPSASIHDSTRLFAGYFYAARILKFARTWCVCLDRWNRMDPWRQSLRTTRDSRGDTAITKARTAWYTLAAVIFPQCVQKGKISALSA
jgi:hypothetical protein